MFLPSLSGYSIENKSASDQINIGAIGINGMGWGNTLKALEVPGVNLVAVCDVDENVIKRRLNSEEGKSVKNKTNYIIILISILVFAFASKGFSILYLFLLADLFCCAAVVTIFYGLERSAWQTSDISNHFKNPLIFLFKQIKLSN